MISRQDLKNISKTRLKEAKILYNNGLYDGAKYLLGYSLETAFKAIICRILDTNYPERGDITRVYHTHKFDILVVLSGLEKKIDEKKYNDSDFAVNWSILTDPQNSTSWSETLRYEKIGTASKTEIENLLTALEDKNHGVLTWLKRRW